MRLLKQLKDSLIHFAFPHTCEGCGTSVLDLDHFLCSRCLSDLPQTKFINFENNPVEKIFWGRAPLIAAAAHYYFTKGSLLQRLIHQLKYKGNRELGIYLGRLFGAALASSSRFSDVDALIPLPLYPDKEHRRGYNQSTILCKGISEVWGKPILENVVVRTYDTESQTKKNRTERWQNMEGRFMLKNIECATAKHLLLVDDIITTGATLEACARVLMGAPDTRISVATLCISSS